MAEGVFRSKYADSPLISKIDSAGTGAYHAGDSPDSRTMSVLEENGISDYQHQARKLTAKDFTDFDYLLAMDEDNLDDMRSMVARVRKSSKGETGIVQMYGDFGGKKGEEVVDPYYGARNGFEVAYKQMLRFADGLMDHLEKEAKPAS